MCDKGRGAYQKDGNGVRYLGIKLEEWVNSERHIDKIYEKVIAIIA